MESFGFWVDGVIIKAYYIVVFRVRGRFWECGVNILFMGREVV